LLQAEILGNVIWKTNKPDDLWFIRLLEFGHFGNRLITARSLVLVLNKGAWKEKGTLSGASR
jgi:hypothetical protein